MPILKPQDEQAVRQRFDLELKRDAEVTLFTQHSIGGLFIPGRECRSCGPTQQLLEEVSTLTRRIRLEVVDFYGEPERAKACGIERIPAIVVGSADDRSVRFYGMTSGFEFAVLLDAIVAASAKRSSLQLETRRALKKLQQDVHIRVFATPT